MNNFIDVLVDLANELDNNQAHRLADTITNQIKTASDDYDHEYDMVRNEMETAKRLNSNLTFLKIQISVKCKFLFF